MNAYELADEMNDACIEFSGDAWIPTFEEIANMLRQQADRITELEKLLKHSVGSDCREMRYVQEIENKDARIAELEKDLALKTRDRNVFCDFTLAYEKRIEELEKLEQDFIRVIKQTNPNKPQTKPLSDEEIYKLWCESDNTELLPEMRLKDGSINYIITTFAKAIEERHGIK